MDPNQEPETNPTTDPTTDPITETIPENSILATIRKMIGPSASYEVFDTDLIIHINTAFARLCQLGVGQPERPFKITGTDETWDDFDDSSGQIEEVKQYVYLKTRLIFDPPASSAVATAYQAQIDQLEWLLKEVARFGY